MYPSDKYGEYQRLHAFIDVRQCHKGGYYCCRQEVRRYFDGSVKVVDGPAIYSHDVAPNTSAMMQVFSAAQFALECETKAPI
jgi:hypothetical protein